MEKYVLAKANCIDWDSNTSQTDDIDIHWEIFSREKPVEITKNELEKIFECILSKLDSLGISIIIDDWINQAQDETGLPISKLISVIDISYFENKLKESVKDIETCQKQISEIANNLSLNQDRYTEDQIISQLQRKRDLNKDIIKINLEKSVWEKIIDRKEIK